MCRVQFVVEIAVKTPYLDENQQNSVNLLNAGFSWWF